SSRRLRQPSFDVIGEREKVSVAEIGERLESRSWRKVRPIDRSGCGQVRRQVDATLCDQRIDIDVVLSLGALLHNRRLGAGKVEERGHLEANVLSAERRTNAPQVR